MPESGNIWHKRGRDNESRVREYFKRKNCRVLFENIKIGFAEIDLLLIAPNGEIWLVETKSVDSELCWRAPISRGQLRRLKQAFEAMILSSPDFSIRFHLATVNSLSEVNVFYDFLNSI